MVEKGFEPADNNTGQIFNILDGKAATLLIQRLPMTYQKVMRMRHVQDLTLKEMSLITGQTKNALAVQLHRGLGKLKLLYGRANKKYALDYHHRSICSMDSRLQFQHRWRIDPHLASDRNYRAYCKAIEVITPLFRCLSSLSSQTHAKHR